jgi:hypothetical protein
MSWTITAIATPKKDPQASHPQAAAALGKIPSRRAPAAVAEGKPDMHCMGVRGALQPWDGREARTFRAYSDSTFRISVRSPASVPRIPS